ncbi:MAG: hypothetical protein FWD89_02160 [Firmicutes bacterium]|nr:hypothetical protein [Bacillota bacterium]
MRKEKILELVREYVNLSDFCEEAADTAVSLAINECATSYFLHREVQEINLTEASFEISTLSKTPIEILRIENGGDDLRFWVFPSYVKVVSDVRENAEVTVTYNYAPQDDAGDFSLLVPNRLIALLAVSNYFFIEGSHAESISFREKFEKAVVGFKNRERVRNVSLPRRSFV